MRMVDADRLKDAIYTDFWEHFTQCHGSDQTALIDMVMYDIDEMPTLTPPNEPLTLEQLRKMKDEPAYLKVFDPRLESGWHIIEAVTENKIIFRGWHTVYVPIDGMGVDYNLYRRPPEGEEGDADRG